MPRKRLNQWGKVDEWGCPGCEGQFIRRKWHKVKQHMYVCSGVCSPRFFIYTTGTLRNKKCKLGHPQCIVPGHSYEIYEQQRIDNKAAKKVLWAANAALEAKKPKWQAHDEKLKGGKYDSSSQSSVEGLDCSELLAKLMKEFDDHPDGYYGVQAAMGSREDWIHWSLQLAQFWKRANVVTDEYQSDVQLHMSTLDTLGKELEEGYQGSYDYVRALHCIFQDSFQRCHLPTPPLLDLEWGMALRDRDSVYKSRMRTFTGYKCRAFTLVKLVIDNPVQDTDCEPSLPAIVHAAERQRFKFPQRVERRRRNHYMYGDDSDIWYDTYYTYW